MDYKRPKQITDHEIETFKDIELNKIFTKKEDEKPSHIFRFRFQYIALILIIAITLTIIGLQDNKVPYDPSTPYIQDDYFIVDKVNQQQYILTTTTQNAYLEFYYNGYIVYENDYVLLGDYQYHQKYSEVPVEIKDQIDIDFHAFSIGEYKYFLEIDVEGETKYFYIEVYGNKTVATNIQNIVIDSSFEKAIRDIFTLIKQYPPVFVEEQNGRPVYRINESISDNESNELVQNYTTFVEKYYIKDDYYTFENPEHTIIISYDNVVVLNEENEIIENHSYTHQSSTQHTDFKENEVPFLTKQTYAYPLGVENISSQSTFLSLVDESLTGYFIEFLHQEEKHAYINIFKDYSLDLSDVDYVEVTYKIKSQFQENPQTESVTLDIINYENVLMIEAYAYTEYFETYSTSVFAEYVVTFYDVLGNEVHKATIID